MKVMVLTKMIGWALVVVVWVIYAIKQALIRDFIGTIIAVFILVLGVVCFRGNRKKWKAMQAEKKAAKEKTRKGGDNITPFPTPEAEEEDGEAAVKGEEAPAPVEEPETQEEAPTEEGEPEKIDEAVE